MLGVVRQLGKRQLEDEEWSDVTAGMVIMDGYTQWLIPKSI